MDVYLWHHRIRAQLTKERLYFWRFSLQTFDANTFFERVDHFLRGYRQPCRSYAIYETFGTWDVLLRCWLPLTISPEVFEVDLLNALAKFGAEDPQYFGVSDIVRHDAWHDYSLREPVADDLRLESINIEPIERHNDRVTKLLQASILAEKAPLDEDLRLHAPDPEVASAVDLALDKGLIAPLNLRRKGVRFYISFSHPRNPLNANQRSDINHRLLRVCNATIEEARHKYEGESPHVALYSGYGTWSTHLITAQAPDGHFYSFSRMLLRALDSEGISRAFPGMKPATTVYASRHAALIRESLIAQGPRSFTEADLERGTEDETLEFKASIWLDARELYETGRRTSFEGGLDAIAKAVCGMLNRTGGIIVVGVAEPDRLPRDRHVAGDPSKLEAAGIPLTADRQFAVLGLEEEYQNKSSQRITDWDSWMRTVREAIGKRISPDPVSMFCVQLQELRLSVRYGSRSLGLIIVTPPRDRSTWFYRDDQFFVRHQGATVPLRGANMDAYRNALMGRIADES